MQIIYKIFLEDIKSITYLVIAELHRDVRRIPLEWVAVWSVVF